MTWPPAEIRVSGRISGALPVLRSVPGRRNKQALDDEDQPETQRKNSIGLSVPYYFLCLMRDRPVDPTAVTLFPQDNHVISLRHPYGRNPTFCRTPGVLRATGRASRSFGDSQRASARRHRPGRPPRRIPPSRPR